MKKFRKFQNVHYLNILTSASLVPRKYWHEFKAQYFMFLLFVLIFKLNRFNIFIIKSHKNIFIPSKIAVWYCRCCSDKTNERRRVTSRKSHSNKTTQCSRFTVPRHNFDWCLFDYATNETHTSSYFSHCSYCKKKYVNYAKGVKQLIKLGMLITCADNRDNETQSLQ